MREWVFASCLDAPEIISRIKIYAKPAKGWSQLLTESFLYQIYDNNRFALMKTTSLGHSGQTPFCATISVDESSGKTIISGRFTQPPERRIYLILFALLSPISILLLGGIQFIAPAIFFFLLACALIYVFFYVITPVFWTKEYRR